MESFVSRRLCDHQTSIRTGCNILFTVATWIPNYPENLSRSDKNTFTSILRALLEGLRDFNFVVTSDAQSMYTHRSVTKTDRNS